MPSDNHLENEMRIYKIPTHNVKGFADALKSRNASKDWMGACHVQPDFTIVYHAKTAEEIDVCERFAQSVEVRIKKGVTWRGVKYFEHDYFSMSLGYARHVVETLGVAEYVTDEML